MSTPRGCDVVELTPNVWYCIVANDEDDYDFESCTVYGPCISDDAALGLMGLKESNPGSCTTYRVDRVTDAQRKRIKESKR